MACGSSTENQAIPSRKRLPTPFLIFLIPSFVYLVYLVLAFDLARRAGWGLRRTALILLAGTIPVLSFLAERRATRLVRDAEVVPVG